MEKKRLDLVLVEKGFFATRQIAQGAIMAGRVLVDGQKKDKAGTLVPLTANIIIKGEDLSYVSRGGLKLKKALTVFPVDLKDKIVLDVGASTGGFTDCALQNGAKKVIAIDVGYGQLAWKLRQDPRVIVLERINARYLTPADLDGMLVDAVTVDVSFISLRLIMPVVSRLAKDTADYILLIKPQFEAGKGKVGKHGVVKDPAIHQEVILNVIGYCKEAGLKVGGLDYSPITGPEGNIEYLIWVTKNEVTPLSIPNLVQNIVVSAHDSLY